MWKGSRVEGIREWKWSDVVIVLFYCCCCKVDVWIESERVGVDKAEVREP